jgi:hypothetical protein
MFMSQLCLDYGRHLLRGGLPVGRPTAAAANTAIHAGQRFAQYALAPLAKRASVLAHELGHVYLGGAPHCGFDTESGAPSSRWRACFDVAAEALLARLTAENGLPIDAYVASDAQGGPPTQSDPDFTDRNVEERDLDRPFFVFELAWGLPTCGAVVDGNEYMSDEVAARYAIDQSGACVGRQRSTLAGAGAISGGLQFATTNGCECLTPTIDAGSSRPAVERFEVDRTTACLAANIGARGVYVLFST